MTVKEMRSKVCTMAHAYRRVMRMTMSEAFRYAWGRVKREIEQIKAAEAQGKVKAANLKTGDTVTIEYGDYDNYVTCTVINKVERRGYFVINATATNGLNIEFCAENNDMFDLVA